MSDGIHRIVRLVVLALLVAAFIGPWGYTPDGVPPPEWCAEPNFLLTPERCVRLLPGTEILSFFVGSIIALPLMLFSSGFSLVERGRELLFVLLMYLLVLPFITGLILALARTSRRLLVLDMVAWGLAAIPAVMIAFFTPEQRGLQLWGVWLYIGLAAAMLLFGVWALLRKRRAETSLSAPV